MMMLVWKWEMWDIINIIDTLYERKEKEKKNAIIATTRIYWDAHYFPVHFLYKKKKKDF